MLLRRLCLILFVCLQSLWAAAQFHNGVFHLSIDSLPRGMNGQYWHFSPSAAESGKDTALDDSRWTLISPNLYLQHRESLPDGGFRGEGWMRLHLMADSSVVGVPLALSIFHYGASRIFLDGRLIEEYGRIGSEDSAEYFDPQGIPLPFILSRSGHHLLAVHYANWDWKHNRKLSVPNAGFRIVVGSAASLIYDAQNHNGLFIAIMMTLFGIFGALALTHLILFLYYRAEKSNKLFARFAFCMSLLFLLPVIMNMTHDPDVETMARFTLILFTAASCISLSALTTQVLNRRRWPLYIISGLGMLSLTVGVNVSWGTVLIIALIIATPFHVVGTVVGAIWRRVPGARILGAGVLFFTGMLLYAIGSIVINGDLLVDDSTLSGKIFELILMAAILSIPVSMSAYLSWRFATVNRSLSTQLAEVERLSAKTMEAEAEKQRLLESRQEELEREVAERTASLRDEKEKSDILLRNILPEEVAAELKEKGSSEARLYNNVSVLFTDFVNFTQIAETLSPADLVAEIHHCFKAFDGIIERHGLEKIKTVGDAYIAVSGMPAENPSHAGTVVGAALEIREYILQRKEAHPAAFNIRLGVHSGPVVAGIVGVKKFAYDIWGDTVNTAARMEQHSEPGKVNISAATHELVKDVFRCSYRGELEAKHKGKMGMYFVEGRLAMASA